MHGNNAETGETSYENDQQNDCQSNNFLRPAFFSCVLHVSVMVVDGVVLFKPTSNSPNRGKMKYLTTEIGSNLNFIFFPLHFSSWLHL